MKTPSVLLAGLLAVAPLAAQEDSEPPSPRQAGASDLDAWSRQSFGAAGSFTNPDTSAWIPWRPAPQDVDAGGILDASHLVEAPSGTHGFLRDDGTIADGERLLITALGRARNTGTRYGNAADRIETTDRHATDIRLPPEHRVAVLEVGTAPILTEPIVGRLSLAIEHPEAARVFVLNDVGERIGKAEAMVREGRLVLDLPGHNRSRFMEVVR